MVELKGLCATGSMTGPPVSRGGSMAASHAETSHQLDAVWRAMWRWNGASGSGPWRREETMAVSQFTVCVLPVPKGPLEEGCIYGRLPSNQTGQSRGVLLLLCS